MKPTALSPSLERRLGRMLNVEDLRQAAKAALPRGIFEYVDRGSEDETALRENREAFDRVRLLPQVLADVSARTTATTLFGRPAAQPVVVAPMSPTGLLWHEGELAVARAAAAAGVPYTLATESMTALEHVAAQAGGRLWFQLYYWADRELSYALLDRVERAGYEALVLTVDTCVGPNREYNAKNGFGMPYRPSVRSLADMLAHPRWLLNVLLRYVVTTGVPLLANHPPEHQRRITEDAPNPATRLNPSISWDDVRTLRRRWSGPLLVKGILRADDAVRAVEHGVDGIVVSNHGARNFDSAVASIDALPAVADAVGARTTLLLDSGVRRGTDIAKALSLGARGVMVGRPVLFGLAAAGEAGAHRALRVLGTEFDRALAYLGCIGCEDLGRHLVAPRASAAVARGPTGSGT